MKLQKKLTDVSLEVFPAEKSCAQGCPPCPLARRNTSPKAKVIHPKVQETFSLLEEVIHQQGRGLQIHFTSTIGANDRLFPALKYPKGVRMARFETHETIRNPGEVEVFASAVRSLVRETGMNPDTIDFSLVPETPMVSSKDMALIEEIFGKIASWHFDDKSLKTVSSTVRSNLIAYPLFIDLFKGFFPNDEAVIRPTMQRMCGRNPEVVRYKPNNFGKSFADIHIHSTVYAHTEGLRKMEISNRIIATEPRKNKRLLLMDQAAIARLITEQLVDIVIAPSGIMFQHSSAFINNPILWISHEEFKSELLQQTNNPDFTLESLVEGLIEENALIYGVSSSEKKCKDLGIAAWKKIFEVNRAGMRAYLKEHPTTKQQETA